VLNIDVETEPGYCLSGLPVIVLKHYEYVNVGLLVRVPRAFEPNSRNSTSRKSRMRVAFNSRSAADSFGERPLIETSYRLTPEGSSLACLARLSPRRLATRLLRPERARSDARPVGSGRQPPAEYREVVRASVRQAVCPRIQCVQYGKEANFVNYINGANIAGFVKVADAMLDQGVV